jgi:hypothetical protein
MDISHNFGGDLSIGPTGDIALADGAVLGQQRVLRRLLTNTGDYIWNIGYGAGLAQFVGQPANALQIQAVMRSQMFEESSVATTPAPAINVSADAAGSVSAQVIYTDAPSQQAQVLSFSLGS